MSAYFFFFSTCSPYSHAQFAPLVHFAAAAAAALVVVVVVVVVAVMVNVLVVRHTPADAYAYLFVPIFFHFSFFRSAIGITDISNRLLRSLLHLQECDCLSQKK